MADEPHGRSDGFGLTADARATLRERTVWITGGGTGFGRAVAVGLALCGGRAIVTGRRADKLRETIDEAVHFGAEPDRVVSLPMDMTSAEACDAAVSPLRAAGVNGFVHCAAVPQPRRPAALLGADDLPALLRSNVEGAWRTAQAFVRAAAPGGIIRGILYSSEAAWHFTPGFGPYNVSKAALNSLGASLAAEAAALYPDADVQINVLNPGEARTEMNSGSTISPFIAVPMTLALLAHPTGGPNGCFFHADGRALAFGRREPWPAPLLSLRRAADAPPALVASIARHNIVFYRGVYFGIPQSLGEIRLEASASLPSEVITADSLDSVTTRIRQLTGDAPRRQ